MMDLIRTSYRMRRKAYGSWSLKSLALLILIFLNANAFADTADPADPATWTVTPGGYAYDMTMTAVLYFDLEESTDPNDRIAAFYEDDCRGVEYTRTVVEGRYLAYLRIYGNNSSGDTLTLYMYDSSKDQVVEVVEKVNFVPQANYGTQNSPYKVTVTFDVSFTVASEEGPLSDASVTLGGFGTKITDASGKVSFVDIPPAADISYSVEKGDYLIESGLLTVDNDDVSTEVILTLKTYTLTVHVTDGNIPIEDMSVNINGIGTRITNVYGKAVFHGLLSNEDLYYEVSGNDYYAKAGEIDGIAEDRYEKIVLVPKTFNLKVRTSDDDIPVEGMNINCIVNGNSQVEDFFDETLPEAFTTYGNGMWTVTPDTMLQGEYAVRSANIHDNQETSLKLEQYTREGYISFYYKVSSEANNDVLVFEMDGEEVSRWSGEVPWDFFRIKIPAGMHAFEWRYMKDGNYSAGEDAAWVDYISIPAADSVIHQAMTDANGEVIFYNIRPYNAIVLEGYSELHEEFTGNVEEIRNDTVIEIEMTPVYDLEFNVRSDAVSGSIPVRDAEVVIAPGRTNTTDYEGYTIFDRVSIGTVVYTISAEGFYDYTDSVSVVDGLATADAVLELIPQFKATNVITPNGDGYNDYWEIYNVWNYGGFTVSIYSAAGELLYQTTDYENNKWNGKAGDRKLPDGIYYYIINSPNDDMVFKGIINLKNK